MNKKITFLIIIIIVIAAIVHVRNPNSSIPSVSHETAIPEQDTEHGTESIIGMTSLEAAAYAERQGVPFRVIEANGQSLPATRDFRIGRINASTQDDIVIDFFVEGQEQEAGEHADIIGMTEAEAQAYAESNNVPFRVGRVDGEDLMLTLDFVPERITAEIENGIIVDYSIE